MDLERLAPPEVSKVGKIIDLLGHAGTRVDLERHIAILEGARQVYMAELMRVREKEGE